MRNHNLLKTESANLNGTFNERVIHDVYHIFYPSMGIPFSV